MGRPRSYYRALCRRIRICLVCVCVCVWVGGCGWVWVATVCCIRRRPTLLRSQVSTTAGPTCSIFASTTPPGGVKCPACPTALRLRVCLPSPWRWALGGVAHTCMHIPDDYSTIIVLASCGGGLVLLITACLCYRYVVPSPRAEWRCTPHTCARRQVLLPWLCL